MAWCDRQTLSKQVQFSELFLIFCTEFNLVITNTVFKHKDHQKTTSMYPRSNHWLQLNYLISLRRNQNDILDTRVMRCAACSTDHLIRSNVFFLSNYANRVSMEHGRQQQLVGVTPSTVIQRFKCACGLKFFSVRAGLQ